MSIDFSFARIAYILRHRIDCYFFSCYGFAPKTYIIYNILDAYCVSEIINFEQDRPSTQALLLIAPILGLHVAARLNHVHKSGA